MFLVWSEAMKGFAPADVPDVYMVLRKGAPQFFQAMPITPAPKAKLRNKFATEDDLPVTATSKESVLSNAAHPPTFPTDKTKHGWSGKYARQVAQWFAVKYLRPFVVDDDQDDFDVSETENDINLNIELMGRQIVTDVIRRSAVPLADSLGSISANLTGWTDVTTGETMGFSAAVAAEQTIPAAGRVFNYNTIGGDVTLGPGLTAVQNAVHKVPNATMWIVPFRFLAAMRREYIRASLSISERPFLLGSDVITPAQAPFYVASGPLMENIPMLVLPDEIFTAAGHTVVGGIGAADYDIYLVSTSADWSSGAGLRMFGLPGTDADIQSPNYLGMGMFLKRLGPIVVEDGVYTSTGMLLSSKMQFVCGRPDSAAIVSGVTD